MIGNYQSDYNSKSYEIGTRIFCKKPQYNLNIDISHSNDWADTGSGKKKIILAKKSELYVDFSLVTMPTIFACNSNNFKSAFPENETDPINTIFIDLNYKIFFLPSPRQLKSFLIF